jgi:hypothetical protein
MLTPHGRQARNDSRSCVASFDQIDQFVKVEAPARRVKTTEGHRQFRAIDGRKGTIRRNHRHERSLAHLDDPNNSIDPDGGEPLLEIDRTTDPAIMTLPSAVRDGSLMTRSAATLALARR